MVQAMSLVDDFPEVLSVLLASAREMVSCDGAAVMLLTGDHLDVVASAGSAIALSGLTLPVSQMGASRIVLDSGRPVRVDDTVQDERWTRVPGEEKVRSWLGAPLLFGERLTGLLEWTSGQPASFTAQDASIAGEIGCLAAPVLHRAQLLADARLRLRQLVEPCLDARPRVLDLGTELQPVVHEAREYTNAQHAFAFVRDSSGRGLRCVAASGAQQERLRAVVLRGDGTLGGWSAPIVGSSDWRGGSPADREVMAHLGIKRTLILPLRAGGIEVGMLGVAEPQKRRRFSRDALRLMIQLASQASLIVERIYPARAEEAPCDYEMVVQSSPLGIGVLTVVGEIRAANPAFAGLLSRPDRSLLGRALTEFLVPKDADRLQRLLEEVAITGQRQQLDAGIRSMAGGQRYVRISVALARVSDDAGGNLVVMMEDVTPLKILEQERVQHLQELREQHAQLKELDKLKSRFVSNVSHELRTPLAVIKLYATLARKGRPEKQAHYLQTIEQETHRLETMVENILDLTRMDRQALRVHPELLEPEEVITQVLQVYEETALKRGIELQNRTRERLPLLWADKNHLVQMLTNLVDNALKYSYRGGKVWVAAREVEVEGGRHLEIAVGDTGIGIPADEQDKVFERFYRGRNNTASQTGTGLGLAIVQELMARHGGQVTLASEEGRGSVFTLRFPLYQGGAPPERLDSVVIEEGSGDNAQATDR